jgi:glycosyltransferase involved in cell wall biosynthesis
METMEQDSSIRILSLRASAASSAAAPPALLDALGDRHCMVGLLEPELTRASDLFIKLRYFNLDRAAWRARAGFSDATFDALTCAIERQLRRHDDCYDLLLQFQTVFAPGRLEAQRPFAVYTDNIISLTERFCPGWAPLSPGEFAARRQREADICRAAGHVLAWSDFLRDALIADYGCDPRRVSRVGAGANIILPSIESRRWDSATAIFVGRDFVRKGGRFLLQAWAHVRERLSHARLIVVGPSRPPPEVDLTGVDWIGHVADRAELARLYETASVFVMPSLFEPWGHVFLEAMGCGLPCVGSMHCAIPEIVTDGQTGLLVPPEESEPLAEALARLLDDPSLAQTMGRRAYSSVTSEHRWSDVADRISPTLVSVTSEASRVDARKARLGVRRRYAAWGGRARWRAND